MILECNKCGAKNRLPDAGTHKTYRCHRCKTPLADSVKDSSSSHGPHASTHLKRTSLGMMSIPFLLLVAMIAGLIGGVGWATADKVSVGSKESLGIVMYPDERLRETAKPVDYAELGTENITELFEFMKNTMAKVDADGLSAPQVGIRQRIIAIRTRTGISLAGDEVLCLVNPEIVEQDGASTAMEGCVSLPRNCKAEVTRSEAVSVSYLALDGQQNTVIYTNKVVARQIQHEIDHLNGVLVIDYPQRSHFNSRLMVAVATYLLVLTVAVGLYIRNRVRDRRRAS